jgi:hypothetical protein
MGAAFLAVPFEAKQEAPEVVCPACSLTGAYQTVCSPGCTTISKFRLASATEA